MNPETARTEVGAKAMRIGGATDLRSSGTDDSGLIAKQRGRWDSDVAFIYQRPLLGDQIAAATAMGGATGFGQEDICHGFAQRAVR